MRKKEVSATVRKRKKNLNMKRRRISGIEEERKLILSDVGEGAGKEIERRFCEIGWKLS